MELTNLELFVIVGIGIWLINYFLNLFLNYRNYKKDKDQPVNDLTTAVNNNTKQLIIFTEQIKYIIQSIENHEHRLDKCVSTLDEHKDKINKLEFQVEELNKKD